MPLSARVPLPLALAAGLSLAVAGAPGLANTPASGGVSGTPSTTAARAGSSTPSLGEAFGPSSPAQIALADHLRAKGVVFYGAFWCQHCFRQKVLFGQEAGNRLPYIECAKDAAGAQACEAAGVLAYPTWVMGKEKRLGVQTLAELASWTGFKGTLDGTSSKTGN